MEKLDTEIARLAENSKELAVGILKEAIRIPADFVDRSPDDGGDPSCGLSNHEGPRIEFLRRTILEIGAVDRPEDVSFDAFGNLTWSLEDPEDGVPRAAKTVVWLDGHCDTVKALRHRWHETIGGGIDPYLGLVDPSRVDRKFLEQELGWLPPESEWSHLVWGRGSADQLGGLVAQIVATKILRELRPLGSLRGVIWRSFATVAEEDNDGGGPMAMMRDALRGNPEALPDAVILTDSTGSARDGAVGIYRGQRGRMQIEVRVTGKSCHGSMPHEGRNPLEHGAAILVEAARAAAGGEGLADNAFLGRGTRTASFATLETPSDCAVPERFTFRFDRRLTAGEDPAVALQQIDSLPSVAAVRAAGLEVEIGVPHYGETSWRGVPADNPQIYPGWVTPEDHPAVAAAVDAYRRVVTPSLAAESNGGGLRREPRVGRWVFSTDGVGFPVSAERAARVPASKRWVSNGPFRHPAMIGIGAGIEQNTHKIGECVDAREIPVVTALLARFPTLLRDRLV